MPASPRLEYEPLGEGALDEFHALVQDAHIRRYLMDGEVFPPEWSAQRIRGSEALAARRGVALWLVRERGAGAAIGFCGFIELPVLPEPQLVYALTEPATNKGYATEMAAASIEHARNAGFAEIVAGVDEVNDRSVRVLEKLGFTRIETMQGSFGNLLIYRRVL